MRKIIVAEFMSLDGVIQAPGGPTEDTDGGFTQGGWTWPYWHDDMGAHFMTQIDRCDTLLLGRKTWQTHGEAFEPMGADNPENPFGGIVQKYVVSTTLQSTAVWSGSTLISQNVVEEVRRLKQQPGKAIFIDGSSVLVHTLMEHDLVDEYNLLVYPIVLGNGKSLFPVGWQGKLTLMESKVFPSGVVLMRYKPADIE